MGRISTRVQILTVDCSFPGGVRRRPVEADAAQPPPLPVGSRVSGSLDSTLERYVRGVLVPYEFAGGPGNIAGADPFGKCSAGRRAAVRICRGKGGSAAV